MLRKFIQNKFGKIAEPKYSIAQMLSADCIGLSHYYEIHHRPHILNRSMLKNFFDHNSQNLDAKIDSKYIMLTEDKRIFKIHSYNVFRDCDSFKQIDINLILEMLE